MPRRRPGDPPPRPVGRVLRSVLIVLLALAVVVVLFTQVFPRVERLLDQPTLGSAASPR